MKSPAARLRNQIRFASTFKLKVKDFGAAQDRAVGFMRAFTAFVGWKEIVLRVRPLVRSKAQEALHDFLAQAPRGVNHWTHALQTFDRAALEARGVELDEVAHAALAGLGPAQLVSNESSSSGHGGARWRGSCGRRWRPRTG